MQPRVLMPNEGNRVAIGRHGVRFLQRAVDDGCALIEWVAPPAVAGPPVHIHHATDEAFYVLEGRVGFQAGQQTIEGGSGAYVFIPRGLAHTYWNQGPTPARLLIVLSPPDFAPYFEELSTALAAAEDSIEAAIRVRTLLSAKYDIEVVGPPRQAGASV